MHKLDVFRKGVDENISCFRGLVQEILDFGRLEEESTFIYRYIK